MDGSAAMEGGGGGYEDLVVGGRSVWLLAKGFSSRAHS